LIVAEGFAMMFYERQTQIFPTVLIRV